MGVMFTFDYSVFVICGFWLCTYGGDACKLHVLGFSQPSLMSATLIGLH